MTQQNEIQQPPRRQKALARWIAPCACACACANIVGFASTASAQGLHTSLGVGAERYQLAPGVSVDILYAVVGASVSSGRASLGISIPLVAATAAGRIFQVGDRFIVAEGGEAPFSFGLGDLSVHLSYAVLHGPDGTLLATTRLRLPTAVGSSVVRGQVDAAVGAELLKKVWTAIGYAGTEALFYNALPATGCAAPGDPSCTRSFAMSGDVGFFEPLTEWLAWGLGLAAFYAPSEQRGTLDGQAQLRFSFGESFALVGGLSHAFLGSGAQLGLSLGLQTDL